MPLLTITWLNFIMIDALRRASEVELLQLFLILVMPGKMKGKGQDPISAKLAANLLQLQGLTDFDHGSYTLAARLLIFRWTLVGCPDFS